MSGFGQGKMPIKMEYMLSNEDISRNESKVACPGPVLEQGRHVKILKEEGYRLHIFWWWWYKWVKLFSRSCQKLWAEIAPYNVGMVGPHILRGWHSVCAKVPKDMHCPKYFLYLLGTKCVEFGNFFLAEWYQRWILKTIFALEANFEGALKTKYRPI